MRMKMYRCNFFFIKGVNHFGGYCIIVWLKVTFQLQEDSFSVQLS